MATVMQMVNESAATHKEDGGETLAQKFAPPAKDQPAGAPGPSRKPRWKASRRRFPRSSVGAGRDGETRGLARGPSRLRAAAFRQFRIRRQLCLNCRNQARRGQMRHPSPRPRLEAAPPPFTRSSVPSVPLAAPAPRRQPMSDLMNLEGELRLVSPGSTGAKSEIPAPRRVRPKPKGENPSRK